MKGSNPGKSLIVVFGALSLMLTGAYAEETVAGPATPSAQSQRTNLGAVVGTVRDGLHAPVAGALITAAKTDGTAIRAALSGSDGVYTFADLPSGNWSVAAKADGYPDALAVSIEVVGGKAVRSDILLGESTVISSTSPKPGATASGVWDRMSKGQNVAMKDIKSAFGIGDRKSPVQTASLKTPAAAFDVPQPAFPADTVPVVNQAAEKAAPKIPEALQAPDSVEGVDNATPFAYGDFTWLNGSSRNHDTVLDTKYFTPEVRFDTHFMEDFNQPHDHTIVGATESFRSGEFQIEQASVGGDFHWQNVRGRILFMQGMFATTTPRNDASSATAQYPGNSGGVGQWDLQNAYKYVSEAWGGYHFNVQHGLNVDAGIFVSYIGLFSYYNFDNWTYQPSYVSSNTPWFFNGLRIQWFPTNKLKIEPWIVNGWQSYAKFNGHVGLGGQLLWEPKEWIKVVANQYGFGQDNLGLPHTERIHTDDSIELRFYNNQNNGRGLSKIAMSLTGDAGGQYGGGLCATCGRVNGKESFIGWMLYNRYWFDHDTFAVTLGGGEMSNYGRYLTLIQPIDGATAATGTVYFPELPGQRAHMWDGTVTVQYMPRQYITWWMEAGYRHSDVPYFAGRGGVTPPGGNNGLPQYYTCNSGASALTADPGVAASACSGSGGVWSPDLRRSETKLSAGVMVKF